MEFMNVERIQIILAGFGGTTWDGVMGPKTIKQIKQFQQDYMGDEHPDGVAGPKTKAAMCEFITKYPVDFEKLKCPNCSCGGFDGKGIHEVLIYTLKAIQFYVGDVIITSGYRCKLNNKKHGRRTTNHMGNAVDFVAKNRETIIYKCNCQIGWGKRNMKSVEPRELSPTWVHLDVREYDAQYLQPRYYITKELPWET